MNPKYPVYIISKGRWQNPKTANCFEKLGVPYKMVIYPNEYDQYSKVIDPTKLIVTPFEDLGVGGVPKRNFVWEHSINIGAKRHWIFDDNIQNFYRLNNNVRWHISSGTIFRIIEKFVDRYENVTMAGLNYMTFAIPRKRLPPFYLNDRIYSMILLSNQIKHRWRGRYNEDTDLSLRILKDGDCTILFNAFCGDKTATMTMGGGNTETLYEIEDGRLKMSKSLEEQHPDVVTTIWKWDRWQHQVNYKPFKVNKLKLKKGLKIKDQVNNYGMKLIKL
jgi:hypothetical protein